MTGEQTARAGLRQSVEDNRAQVAMTDESRVLLTAMVRAEMRTAVADGIADAMTDENAERFWKKGLEVLQDQAAKQGGLLVWNLLKRAIGIGVLVVLVWLVAGAPAAKALLAAFNRG